MNERIPKIKKTQIKDNLQLVDIKNRDVQVLLREINKTCLDTNFCQKWDLQEISMVHNDELEADFIKKRSELKDEGRGGQCLQDQLAFLTVGANLKTTIASKGLQTSERCNEQKLLGKSEFGVYLNRFFDIELKTSLLAGNEKLQMEIFVFKYFVGKRKTITINDFYKASILDPTPNYDCHTSSVHPRLEDTIYRQNALSQIYLYEYTDACEPSKCPRQCLPYAVIKCIKRSVPTPVSKPQFSAKLDNKGTFINSSNTCVGIPVPSILDMGKLVTKPSTNDRVPVEEKLVDKSFNKSGVSQEFLQKQNSCIERLALTSTVVGVEKKATVENPTSVPSVPAVSRVLNATCYSGKLKSQHSMLDQHLQMKTRSEVNKLDKSFKRSGVSEDLLNEQAGYIERLAAANAILESKKRAKAGGINHILPGLLMVNQSSCSTMDIRNILKSQPHTSNGPQVTVNNGVQEPVMRRASRPSVRCSETCDDATSSPTAFENKSNMSNVTKKLSYSEYVKLKSAKIERKKLEQKSNSTPQSCRLNMVSSFSSDMLTSSPVTGSESDVVFPGSIDISNYERRGLIGSLSKSQPPRQSSSNLFSEFQSPLSPQHVPQRSSNIFSQFQSPLSLKISSVDSLSKFQSPLAPKKVAMDSLSKFQSPLAPQQCFSDTLSRFQSPTAPQLSSPNIFQSLLASNPLTKTFTTPTVCSNVNSSSIPNSSQSCLSQSSGFPPKNRLKKGLMPLPIFNDDGSVGNVYRGVVNGSVKEISVSTQELKCSEENIQPEEKTSQVPDLQRELISNDKVSAGHSHLKDVSNNVTKDAAFCVNKSVKAGANNLMKAFKYALGKKKKIMEQQLLYSQTEGPSSCVVEKVPAENAQNSKQNGGDGTSVKLSNEFRVSSTDRKYEHKVDKLINCTEKSLFDRFENTGQEIESHERDKTVADNAKPIHDNLIDCVDMENDHIKECPESENNWLNGHSKNITPTDKTEGKFDGHLTAKTDVTNKEDHVDRKSSSSDTYKSHQSSNQAVDQDRIQRCILDTTADPEASQSKPRDELLNSITNNFKMLTSTGNIENAHCVGVVDSDFNKTVDVHSKENQINLNDKSQQRIPTPGDDGCPRFVCRSPNADIPDINFNLNLSTEVVPTRSYCSPLTLIPSLCCDFKESEDEDKIKENFTSTESLLGDKFNYNSISTESLIEDTIKQNSASTDSLIEDGNERNCTSMESRIDNPQLVKLKEIDILSLAKLDEFEDTKTTKSEKVSSSRIVTCQKRTTPSALNMNRDSVSSASKFTNKFVEDDKHIQVEDDKHIQVELPTDSFDDVTPLSSSLSIHDLGFKCYLQVLSEKSYQPSVLIVDYKKALNKGYHLSKCNACKRELNGLTSDFSRPASELSEYSDTTEDEEVCDFAIYFNNPLKSEMPVASAVESNNANVVSLASVESEEKESPVVSLASVESEEKESPVVSLASVESEEKGNCVVSLALNESEEKVNHSNCFNLFDVEQQMSQVTNCSQTSSPVLVIAECQSDLDLKGKGSEECLGEHTETESCPTDLKGTQILKNQEDESVLEKSPNKCMPDRGTQCSSPLIKMNCFTHFVNRRRQERKRLRLIRAKLFKKGIFGLMAKKVISPGPCEAKRKKNLADIDDDDELRDALLDKMLAFPSTDDPASQTSSSILKSCNKYLNVKDGDTINASKPKRDNPSYFEADRGDMDKGGHTDVLQIIEKKEIQKAIEDKKKFPVYNMIPRSALNSMKCKSQVIERVKDDSQGLGKDVKKNEASLQEEIVNVPAVEENDSGLGAEIKEEIKEHFFIDWNKKPRDNLHLEDIKTETENKWVPITETDRKSRVQDISQVKDSCQVEAVQFSLAQEKNKLEMEIDPHSSNELAAIKNLSNPDLIPVSKVTPDTEHNAHDSCVGNKIINNINHSRGSNYKREDDLHNEIIETDSDKVVFHGKISTVPDMKLSQSSNFIITSQMIHDTEQNAHNFCFENKTVNTIGHSTLPNYEKDDESSQHVSKRYDDKGILHEKEFSAVQDRKPSQSSRFTITSNMTHGTEENAHNFCVENNTFNNVNHSTLSSYEKEAESSNNVVSKTDVRKSIVHGEISKVQEMKLTRLFSEIDPSSVSTVSKVTHDTKQNTRNFCFETKTVNKVDHITLSNYEKAVESSDNVVFKRYDKVAFEGKFPAMQETKPTQAFSFPGMGSSNLDIYLDQPLGDVDYRIGFPFDIPCSRISHSRTEPSLYASNRIGLVQDSASTTFTLNDQTLPTPHTAVDFGDVDYREFPNSTSNPFYFQARNECKGYDMPLIDQQFSVNTMSFIGETATQNGMENVTQHHDHLDSNGIIKANGNEIGSERKITFWPSFDSSVGYINNSLTSVNIDKSLEMDDKYENKGAFVETKTIESEDADKIGTNVGSEALVKAPMVESSCVEMTSSGNLKIKTSVNSDDGDQIIQEPQENKEVKRDNSTMSAVSIRLENTLDLSRSLEPGTKKDIHPEMSNSAKKLASNGFEESQIVAKVKPYNAYAITPAIVSGAEFTCITKTSEWECETSVTESDVKSFVNESQQPCLLNAGQHLTSVMPTPGTSVNDSESVDIVENIKKCLPEFFGMNSKIKSEIAKEYSEDEYSDDELSVSASKSAGDCEKNRKVTSEKINLTPDHLQLLQQAVETVSKLQSMPKHPTCDKITGIPPLPKSKWDTPSQSPERVSKCCGRGVDECECTDSRNDLNGIPDGTPSIPLPNDDHLGEKQSKDFSKLFDMLDDLGLSNSVLRNLVKTNEMTTSNFSFDVNKNEVKNNKGIASKLKKLYLQAMIDSKKSNQHRLCEGKTNEKDNSKSFISTKPCSDSYHDTIGSEIRQEKASTVLNDNSQKNNCDSVESKQQPKVLLSDVSLQDLSLARLHVLKQLDSLNEEVNGDEDDIEVMQDDSYEDSGKIKRDVIGNCVALTSDEEGLSVSSVYTDVEEMIVIEDNTDKHDSSAKSHIELIISSDSDNDTYHHKDSLSTKLKRTGQTIVQDEAISSATDLSHNKFPLRRTLLDEYVVISTASDSDENDSLSMSSQRPSGIKLSIDKSEKPDLKFQDLKIHVENTTELNKLVKSKTKIKRLVTIGNESCLKDSKFSTIDIKRSKSITWNERSRNSEKQFDIVNKSVSTVLKDNFKVNLDSSPQKLKDIASSLNPSKGKKKRLCSENSKSKIFKDRPRDFSPDLWEDSENESDWNTNLDLKDSKIRFGNSDGNLVREVGRKVYRRKISREKIPHSWHNKAQDTFLTRGASPISSSESESSIVSSQFSRLRPSTSSPNDRWSSEGSASNRNRYTSPPNKTGNDRKVMMSYHSPHFDDQDKRILKRYSKVKDTQVESFDARDYRIYRNGTPCHKDYATVRSYSSSDDEYSSRDQSYTQRQQIRSTRRLYHDRSPYRDQIIKDPSIKRNNESDLAKDFDQARNVRGRDICHNKNDQRKSQLTQPVNKEHPIDVLMRSLKRKLNTSDGERELEYYLNSGKRHTNDKDRGYYSSRNFRY